MEAKKTGTHRVLNPKYQGKCQNFKLIDLMESRGVQAEYCVEEKQIRAYLFDITQWTEQEAKDWVIEHAKDYGIGQIKATTSINKGRIVAVASTEDRDREGEIISMDGWNLKAFKENPVLLWMHNMASGHNGLPIGRAKDIKVTKMGAKRVLQFEPEFDDSTDFNRTVKKFYEDGIMSTFSVGFIGEEREGNKFTKQELLEISAVPVPANSQAMVVQRGKELGISKEKSMQVVDIKETVPFKSFDLMNEDREWDPKASESRVRKFAGETKDKIDMSKYSEAFGWYDKENPGDFRSYKFIHHDSEGSGLVTVWRGIKGAMISLLRDTELSEEEKREVYDHLVKHYEEFDKTPPEFKTIVSEELKELMDQLAYEVRIEDMEETRKHLQEIRAEIRKNRREKKQEIIYDTDLVEALKILNHASGIALKQSKDLESRSSQGKEGKL